MKKNAKKGFTLIEIIVVLVILAILAAAAIPTMNGFINEAKGKQYIAEARAAMLGCKALEAQSVDPTAFKCETEADTKKALELAGIEISVVDGADNPTISESVKGTYVYITKGQVVTIVEGVSTTVAPK